MEKNVGIFNSQGAALSEFAKPSVKCLVVGKPANTNAAIPANAAPTLPTTCFSALTRLDYNRAASLAAKNGPGTPPRASESLLRVNETFARGSG